ncbi:transcriptional regulator, putative [hydrothermal vent metagenome]|uniref:Transcriptional regulator, putative n=1 Tax=hydrothermal vent metagenome TaxID=652676 RepID=A0A1W1CDX1_9ZZZZ
MNSEKRVLYIVNRLLEKEVSNSILAMEIYGEDSANSRTKVRNSIKVIKNTFGEKCVETAKGKHKLVDIPKTMRDLYKNSAKGMMEVFEFISLFDSHKLEVFEQSEPELVAKIKKETTSLYHLFDSPFEPIEDEQVWQDVKKSVKYRQYISVAYKKNKLRTYNNIKPIRIVYAKNNWYLAALLTEEIDDFDFTFLRINNIKHIEINKNTFYEDAQVLSHLKNMQSLFESYNMPQEEIFIEVSKSIATYFKRKKYLKTQEIVEECKDGSLLIRYKITNYMEILPIIKQWIPNIRIIKPISLKNKIEQIFRDYVK